MEAVVFQHLYYCIESLSSLVPRPSSRAIDPLPKKLRNCSVFASIQLFNQLATLKLPSYRHPLGKQIFLHHSSVTYKSTLREFSSYLSKKQQGFTHAWNFQFKIPTKSVYACTVNLHSVQISSFAVDESMGWMLQVIPTLFLHRHLPKVQHSLGSHEHLLRWPNTTKKTQRLTGKSLYDQWRCQFMQPSFQILCTMGTSYYRSSMQAAGCLTKINHLA